jgi:hypothetical protein
MENLPVGFMSFDNISTIDRAAMTNAISILAEIIWKKGGFRFRHRTTIWKDRTYAYSCSQDAESASKSVAQGQRDAPRMERFPCQSQLVFRPSFGDRTLTVILKHTHHAPYRDHQLCPAVVEFIQARVAVSTPSEIYRDLQAAQPSGWEYIATYQVYYQWQQSNSKIWRRDQDPLKSAQALLSEYQEYT